MVGQHITVLMAAHTCSMQQPGKPGGPRDPDQLEIGWYPLLRDMHMLKMFRSACCIVMNLSCPPNLYLAFDVYISIIREEDNNSMLQQCQAGYGKPATGDRRHHRAVISAAHKAFAPFSLSSFGFGQKGRRQLAVISGASEFPIRFFAPVPLELAYQVGVSII